MTPAEATYCLASVTADDPEPPLVWVDDDRVLRSDRAPPRVDGTPANLHFFEAPGRLRLETIVHMAAMARLREEFGWPREHLIFESPRIVDDDGNNVLSGGAVDILLLEEPRAELSGKMTIATTRSRVIVETKADSKRLERLVHEMRACQTGGHSGHKKCRAIEVLRPPLFLAVAAGETWRLFSVAALHRRTVLHDELPDLQGLYFKR